MSRVLPGTADEKQGRFGCLSRDLRSETATGRRRNAVSVPLLVLAIWAALFSISPYLEGASAQTLQPTNPDAQLLLKADELIYDNDAQVVTAIGDVQLDYDGYNVVADRVSYNRKTRRVMASGNVELLEPDGNRIFADRLDLTDDFSDGFVDALRIETPENTRFAAESAERFDGNKTVFNNGVYTACEPCRSDPDKAPIWQVKAQQVIHNGIEKTITYRGASFELFGMPIAYLPYFSHADPTVKRKSGFLIPSAGYESELGFWYKQRYFLVTGDSHDLTLGLTGFTKQGVLGEAKWRHQLENGYYEIQTAGISQEDPSAFDFEPSKVEVERGLIASKGKFDINPRWTFGWKVLAQTDENFARTYEIDGYTSSNITNEVYLKGLHDRSFFKLAGYQFLIQTNTIVALNEAFSNQDDQADVLPVLDYNYVTTETGFGGQVNFDIAAFNLDRDRIDIITPRTPAPDERVHGIAGRSSSLSAQLQWKKTLFTPSGFSITPSAALRGDVFNVDGDANTPGIVEQGSTFRYMPTAALEVSYPLLARTETSSHVFEPVAQLLVRPSLNFEGVLPNEDAQSLVFDTSTLFQHDKFSGYHRIEGGTRLNAGLKYSGAFGNGISLNAVVGQSYHLAGRNPYAREDDLVNTGEESGLESDRSDYVASIGVATPLSLLLNLQGRFDEDNFALRRGEASFSYISPKWRLSSNYTFIDEQKDVGFPDDRQQVGFSANYKISDSLSVYGAAQYDIQDNRFVSDSVGFKYSSCECLTVSLSYRERRTEDETDRSIGFLVSLRTLGDLGGTIDTGLFTAEDDEALF